MNMKRTVAAILSMSFAVSVCSAFQAAAADETGGFDMSQMGGMDWSQMGGAGGFDMSQMGGMDWSQMGGGDAGAGGFDMSQMGGMDWSQFTGGGDAGAGGFDMSQMGGMDWSQMGGAGGMDWSQFTGGGDGGAGGMDWSQFTGGGDGGAGAGDMDWSQFTGAGGGLGWSEQGGDSSSDTPQTGGQTQTGTSSTTGSGVKGDVNGDKKVDKSDVTALQGYLLGKDGSVDGAGADVDGNNKVTAADLSKLKDLVMNPPAVVTEPGPSSTASHSAKEYNAIVAADFQRNVPANVKQGDSGKTEKIQYFSKKANRNKPANVWTPPGYDSSKKYPVMFMSHGVMGGENDMLNGWGIREMASNLIKSGEAVPFIIVFPQMYTDPQSASPNGINMNVMDNYDTFVYDVRDSLYPYICEHYSVATGRNNTAVAGFSMGGRESLYLGLMMPDMIGYVCASSPAPGIVPASDMYISNHLGSKKLDSEQRMTNADFKFSDEDLPYILMIGGGTSDQVVGTFPKQYHELFDKNGTTNVWQEFAGAGHDAGVGTPLFYNFFRYVFKA